MEFLPNYAKLLNFAQNVKNFNIWFQRTKTAGKYSSVFKVLLLFLSEESFLKPSDVIGKYNHLLLFLLG